jgi:hypothetical protein
MYYVWEGYLRKIPVERRTISRAEWRAKFSFKTVQHNIFIEKHMKFVQHQMYNLSSNKSLKIPKGGNQNP